MTTLKIVVPNIPHITRRVRLLGAVFVKPRYEIVRQINTPNAIPVVLRS